MDKGLSLRDAVNAEQTAEALRSTIASLTADLGKARLTKEEMVAAVYRAARDAASGLVIPPVAPPVGDTRMGKEETAIVVFSDLQLGQVTADYDSKVAEQRAILYADKVERFTRIQRADHPVRTCRVYMLGDLIEGELIFPHQPHQIDASLFQQVALDGPRILLRFLRQMLAIFDRVEVVSVPGNHGDVGGGSRKAYNPETNFDRMLSQIVADRFEGEPRISFTIPAGYGRTSWYAVDRVGKVGFLLWHGHQAKRHSSSSHLPFFKLVQGWANDGIPERFDVSLCGHHHVPTFLTMNRVLHYINGTFASKSEYAQERLASTGRPAQWVLFTDGERPITAQYLADLELPTHVARKRKQR